MSTHNIAFQYEEKEKITLSYPKSADMGLFQGTQELGRNSHGRWAISAPATEVLLYYGNTNITDCQHKGSLQGTCVNILLL